MNQNFNSDIFISPMQDTIFKALWNNGTPETKEFLARIISHIIGKDIRQYHIASNEIPVKSKKSIANKCDILLVSNDNLHKVNIELNPVKADTTVNKNSSYLFKLAGEFYSGMKKADKYKDDILVEQVNLNGYPHKQKEIAFATYRLYDVKNKLEMKSIKIHDIFLPSIQKICYDNNEIYLDLAMFTSHSFEEMKKYICDNKERESVMKELQNFIYDENIPTYDYEEYLEILKNELTEKAYAEAHQNGLAEGIEKGRKKGLEEGIAEGIEKGRKKGLEEGIAEGIEKGRKKGLEEGIAEGIEKGRKKGLEEGIAEGKKEAVEEMVKKMKNLNIPLKDISAASGLTIEEIEEI